MNLCSKPFQNNKGDNILNYTKQYIDQNAHEAATSPRNDLQEPTKKMKKTGRYKKGHLNLFGLNINIENPKGSCRRGTGPNGKRWKRKLHHHYGDIKRFKGNDGDPIDCFVGDDRNSNKVFVINQRNPTTGQFDEHKVMLLFKDLKSAVDGYLKNYDQDWEKKGGIMSVGCSDTNQFKDWLRKNNLKTPFTG